MRYVFVLLALVLAVVVSATSVGIGINPENFAVWRYLEVDENNLWEYRIEFRNISNEIVLVKMEKEAWYVSEKEKKRRKANLEEKNAKWIQKYGSDAQLISTSFNGVRDSAFTEIVVNKTLAPDEVFVVTIPHTDSLFSYLSFSENGNRLGILEYQLYELPKNFSLLKHSRVSTEGLNGTDLYFGWITARKNPDTKKTIYTLCIQSNLYYNADEILNEEFRLIISGANLKAIEIKTDLKRIMISNDSCAFVLPKKDGDFETEDVEFTNNSQNKPFVCLLYFADNSLSQNLDFKSEETWKQIKFADRFVMPNF